MAQTSDFDDPFAEVSEDELYQHLVETEREENGRLYTTEEVREHVRQWHAKSITQLQLSETLDE